MSDILLAKPVLPEGWIDLSVGESVVVRNAVLKHFNLSLSHASLETVLDYPPPNGNKELVALLEDKYQAPVVLTNGAKQGLGAAFYCLKKRNKPSISMRCPYWALIPPLMEAHGVSSYYHTFNPMVRPWTNHDAMLYVLPNNPDGAMFSPEELQLVINGQMEAGIPVIHDAVYYTHSYLPQDYPLVPIGDMQIYSVSKMYGLSGLRLGFIVCHNKDYFRDLCEYVEMMTVGVSTASQQLFIQLLQQEKVIGNGFEIESFNNLRKAKLLLKTVNPDVLECPDDKFGYFKKFEDTPGMFAWVKLKKLDALTKAKINVISGEPFGDKRYVRMNLGVPLHVIQEVVDRLR